MRTLSYDHMFCYIISIVHNNIVLLLKGAYGSKKDLCIGVSNNCVFRRWLHSSERRVCYLCREMILLVLYYNNALNNYAPAKINDIELIRTLSSLD